MPAFRGRPTLLEGMISLSRAKSLGKSVDIEGRKADLAEKAFDPLLKEARRESEVAKSLGLKAESRILGEKAKAIEGMSDGEKLRLLFSSEILNQLKSQNIALRDQLQSMQLSIQVQNQQRQQMEAYRREVDKEVGGILTSDAAWEEKGPIAQRVKDYRQRKLRGEDVSGLATPEELYIELQKSVEDAKTETAAEKGQAAADKAALAARYKPSEAFVEHTDVQSWHEYELGLMQGSPPELREIYIPKWKTGPSGMHYVTKKRAIELGILGAWNKAGTVEVQSGLGADLTKTSIKELVE